MLFLQAVLVAVATCFAAAAVARWRGVWAGLAFLGLTYIYVREFVPTSLTELLGLSWALVSIPFFIEAMRTRSLPHALVALAMTAAALLTRMGSMFTIPALIVWTFLQFGRGAKQQMRIAAIAVCVVAGVILTNVLLEKAFGGGRSIAGGNFSYTLCGITLGTDWMGCRAKYERENGAFPSHDEEANRLLYTIAFENFRKDPGKSVDTLLANALDFVHALPELFWRSYSPVDEPPWLPRTPIMLIALVGLAFTLAKRREAGEISFWSILLASVILSSAFVFRDDGRRVMAVSYPLLWLLLSSGFATPPAVAAQRTKADRALLLNGYATLSIAVLLFLAVPWLAHRLAPRLPTANASPPTQHVVFGPPRMNGFLIVDDGEPLRKEIPTLHVSDFARMLGKGWLEELQGLLKPEAPALPFGFVAAPRLETGAASVHQYIVPAAVMERRDVAVWRFDIVNWQVNPKTRFGPYWFYVTRAEPLN